MAIDLVCKMPVSETEAEYTSVCRGRKYYFCAEPCKREFDTYPNDYVLGKLDFALSTMFCPNCGNPMLQPSSTDRIYECMGCGHLGLQLRFEANDSTLPMTLRTLLKKCGACDSVRLADDLFCRTCGRKTADYSTLDLSDSHPIILHH